MANSLSSQHRAWWVLIGIAFVLIFANIFAINRVLVLNNQLEISREAARVDATAIVKAQRAGCERGNVSRENDRYVLAVLAEISEVVGQFSATSQIREYFDSVGPELERRQQRPEVQDLDCINLYPLPTPD